MRLIIISMKQVIQNFKSGELYVDEVPVPALSEGMVLVENRCSLISAGTERSTVKVAQANLLGKARQRPELVAQVLQNIKKEGLKATLEKVRTKLDALKALGYSSAGTVLASLDTDSRFKPGDRVACAGQDYASHAELVCIPQNLVVRIPDNVSFEEASFTTLGAIAMQGVRQADPKLGENICVIGLGLLGQITAQLLKANGCRVLGIDLSDQLLELARTNGIDEAVKRNESNILSRVQNFTNGYGFDAIIITAATSSNDPIELSAEIARKKGKVVVVGAVNMDIPRDPHFYRKELSLLMSCSYGPGRYDTEYELHGTDYPYAYVRWTEQRNMEAFLQLIAQKRIHISSLITHRFEIDQATDAYDIVMGKKKEHHIGIVLNYPERDEKMLPLIPSGREARGGDIRVGFIGAGSFAQSYLIPHLKDPSVALDTVVTTRGITAKNVSDKFGFAHSATDPEVILGNTSINTVFIATPHNSHGRFVLDALNAGKNVFVEKPLALTYGELEAIRARMESDPGHLMVGFNRRFSPAARKVAALFANSSEPLLINYRINAGFIPKDHWSQDERIGGGRIKGEVCHFVDLIQYLTGSDPESVFAACLNSDNSQYRNNDNLAVVLRMKNGSLANITYAANGNKGLPKEQIEVFGEGKSAVISDFRETVLYYGSKTEKFRSQGKGHKEEVQEFIGTIRNNQPAPIAFNSLYLTTLTCLKIEDSLASSLPQTIG